MLAPKRHSTILILEDDEGIAELEKQQLEEAGYRIHQAITPDEALQILRETTIDLLLLDYRLPGDVNGLDFYAHLKEAGFNVPVILVTGFSNEATIIQAMRLGVRDFVTKSMEYLDYLPEAIDRVLNQVHTERQLAESQARLSSIIATAKDAILVTDETHRIILFNAAAEKIFGCSSAEATGQALFNFILPEFEPANPKTSSQQNAGTFSHQIRTGSIGARADGRQFPLEASLSRHQVNGNKFHTIVVRDITDRKRIEDTLEKERQFLRALHESLQSGIVSCNREGILTSFNQSSRDFHGANEEPLPPERWAKHYDLYRPDGKTLLQMEEVPLYRALQGERVRDVEMMIIPKNSSARTLLVSGQPFQDAAGELLGAVVTMQDISERKKLEAQLVQAQRMEAIGALAGGVAHDFNNLLTVIIGYCEMLSSESQIAPADREMILEVRRAGEQAASLTRQLLAFSRKQVLTPQIVDVNVLISEIQKMLRRLIGADITLTASLGTNLGRVKADPGQLEQVIMNLVVNARDAMPRGGSLTIETRAVQLSPSYSDQHLDVVSGDYVLLSVTDTGSGMDDATQARIFEPFFTTKEIGRGTGLGLATVHGIVKQSDGHIEVYSELGVGTTFKVYLPRLDEKGGTQKISTATLTVPRGTETILLAEDDAGIRALAGNTLQTYGYTVLSAADGIEGLQVGLAHGAPIHLLLTDVVMPKMSGREMVERLQPQHPEMKILYISGYTTDAIVRHGVLEAGVSFLHKPFTPSTLARKVREVLDAAPYLDT